MVAKIFFSTSFLITRLALTPSFSESSFTVTPSATVISRSMGGGSNCCSRRETGRSRPSSRSTSRRRSDREPWLGRMAPAWDRPAEWPARRADGDVGCMARPRLRSPGPRRTARCPRATHQRLTGTNRSGINRTAGYRTRGTASRHAGTGHRMEQPETGDCGETRDHIGPRRHHRPGGRLTSEIRFCGRTQGPPRPLAAAVSTVA